MKMHYSPTTRHCASHVKIFSVIDGKARYLLMNKQGVYNLFQLINVLYEYRSVIITTNKDFTNWGEFFHDNNVAVPIVDRIIHHSHIFMLGGESYRLKQKLEN
jgi:DNA replication protein DnaC